MLKVIVSGMVFAAIYVAADISLHYAHVFSGAHSFNYYSGVFIACVLGWTTRWASHERNRS